jgi:hypothetical protein
VALDILLVIAKCLYSTIERRKCNVAFGYKIINSYYERGLHVLMQVSMPACLHIKDKWGREGVGKILILSKVIVSSINIS